MNTAHPTPWLLIAIACTAAWGCAGDPPSEGGSKTCGDGRIGDDEACDDGNLVSGDGCSATCRAERCGDGVADPGDLCLARPDIYEGGGRGPSAADWHGDESLDVLTADPFSLRRGQSDGALNATADQLGFAATVATTGHFDADGVPDAVATLVDGGLPGGRVLYGGEALPHFDVAQSAALAEGYDVMTVADLDGDGLDDLVGGGPFKSTTDVYLALPGRALAPPLILDTAGTTGHGVSDLDGDGVVDLVALTRDGALITFLGTGSGTFGPPVSTPLEDPDKTLALALGDLDGDGIDDAVATDGGDVLHVMAGAADGTFTPVKRYGTEFVPSSVAVADLDADGLRDVVVGASGSVAVHLGLGGGELAELQFLVEDDSIDQCAVLVADLDADEHPDVVASRGLLDPGLLVFLGNP